MLNKTISHYQILEKLGEGGMGEVYLAEDTKLDRKVALKFLPKEFTKNKEANERFEREAKAAAALNHPNIVTIYEINEHEDQTYIAMEYVAGQTLKEIISGVGAGLAPARATARVALTIKEIINITIQICEGLSKAHEAGIVHRDIKPQNILIDKDNRVKILDFGLAKLRVGAHGHAPSITKIGTTMGTINYMSPEQAMGKDVDHRTDIWSLGVVLYEMITGQLPFKGEYEQAIVYSIINEEPLEIKDINPETSNVIEKIVSRALEKSPYKRFENVNIILKELKPAKVEPRSVLKEKAWILKEPKNQKRKWLLGFISLILICVLIIAYFNYNKRTNPFDSIAVLPFDNKNIEPALEYISEEIPASIINNLSGLKNLRVIPRSTVFKYKKGQDPISIGKKLDVSTILTGQIRVINGMINIRAELVDIKKNRQVWGKRYKQELKNIMEVEEKISRDISEALRFRLSREEKSRLTKHYTKIASAYQAYLQGRFWWNKRSRAGFNKAIKSFNEAIRIDPEYALAYSGKAECYCMLAIHAPLPEEFIKKGREAARRALAIDNTLAQAYTSLGWIKWIYDWDWINAEQSFKTAISLNPDYPTAHNWYAVMLSAQGRHDKAFTHIQRAIQLDPGSLIINRDFGCIYSWAGKFDQAIEQLNKTIEMDPNFTPAHMHLGRVYVTKKMYKEAIVEFQKARDLSGDYYKTTGMLGFTFAKNGEKEKALQQLKILQAMEKKKPVSAFEMALLQTGLENNNMFFSWLEKACENHEFPVVLINVHGWLKHLHTDPRFKKLLKKVGLDK